MTLVLSHSASKLISWPIKIPGFRSSCVIIMIIHMDGSIHNNNSYVKLKIRKRSGGTCGFS